MRGRVLLIALLIASGATPAAAQSDSGSCSYDKGSKAVSVDLPANAGGRLYVWKGKISFGTPFFDGQCGRATVRNTSQISVLGRSNSSEIITLDLSTGTFTPGSGKDSGEKEVEISIDLAGDEGFFTHDEVHLIGTDGADLFTAGSDGLALNGDDDLDVAIAGIPRLFIEGRAGPDTIQGQGGHGSGLPYQLPVEFWADHVNNSQDMTANVLIGGESADRLNGSWGDDLIRGMGGDDGVFGFQGANDLHGGDGADSLWGDSWNDVFDGGAGDDIIEDAGGEDVISTGAGNDTIFADDFATDHVDGGSEHDRATVDCNRDILVNIEDIVCD